MSQQPQTETRNGIVLFDLDNCLFDDRWRTHLIKSDLEFAISSDDARFDEYHSQMYSDPVNPIGRKHLDDALENKMFIAFITARPIKFQDVTMAQLTQVLALRPGLDFTLYMRPEGDHRRAADIKLEVATMLKTEADQKKVAIVGAFDDRQDVVDAYLSLGIPAFILNCEGCDAPLLQKVTPSVLNKFQQRFADSAQAEANAAATAPEPARNEQKQDVNVLGAATSVRGNPAADGPTQPQYEPGATMPRPEYSGVDNVLERMAETSRQRYAVYGDNALKIGAVMQALFPNGFTAKTPADHRMISHLDRIVSKLTRFVNSGCKHADSIHDVAAYAAMAELETDYHTLEFRP